VYFVLENRSNPHSMSSGFLCSAALFNWHLHLMHSVTLKKRGRNLVLWLRLPFICTGNCYAPAPIGRRAGGIKWWCASDVWRLSVWCLSVAYVGPNSRTERPRKTKIGTEVAHVTRDSDITFTIKRSTCREWGHIVAASLHSLLKLPSVLWHCLSDGIRPVKTSRSSNHQGFLFWKTPAQPLMFMEE